MIRSMFKTKLTKFAHDHRGLLVAPLALAGLAVVGGQHAHADTTATATTSPSASQQSNAHVNNVNDASNLKSSDVDPNLVTNWQINRIPQAAARTNNVQHTYMVRTDGNGNQTAQKATVYTAPHSISNVGRAKVMVTQNLNNSFDTSMPKQLTEVPAHLLGKAPAKAPSKSPSKKDSSNGGLPKSITATTTAGNFDTIAYGGGHTWDTVGLGVTPSGFPVYCDNPDVNSPQKRSYTYDHQIQPGSFQYKVLEYINADGGKSLSHDQKEVANWLATGRDGGIDDYKSSKPGLSKSDMKSILAKAKADNNQNITAALYKPSAGPAVQTLVLVTKGSHPGKTNTNTTGGGGSTTPSGGSCGGGTAAAGAGGGGGGGAAGGAAAGGAAAGGGAAGGAATAGGAGGATDGTAGGVVGGGAGNNNSTPAGPNNNNILTAGGTQSSNNNPSNNNIVPETPVVNNNDHYSYTNGAGQPDNDYSGKLTTLAAEISQIGTNEGDELADMSDKDMNAKLALSQGHNERNMQLYQAEAQRNSRIQGALDQSNARANVNDQLSDYQTGLSFQALRNRLSVTPANDNSEQILNSFNSQLNDILK